MSRSLLIILISFISVSCFSQKKELKKHVKELETFLNEHIPSGAANVEGYKLRVNGCDLDKETFIKGDHIEHHKVYDLKDALITTQHFEFGDALSDSTGIHSEYWDVDIDDKWILSGFSTWEEAQKLVVLITEVQEVCNYE